MVFKDVSSKVSFPEMEKNISDFWKTHSIFKESVAQRQGSPIFNMYEGPPTANGAPGVHHILARVFKDIIPRFKTMNGYQVPRKGGWDTHGLPVELAIENEIGLHSKADIETYGVEEFNKKCKESVFRYVKEWENLSDRIGFWIDMEDPYITFKNEYIESGWWIFKQLWDKDLIYKDYKVTPHCPRCVTSLSSHEVALGYQENTEDPSVYIKFLIDSKSSTNLPPHLNDNIPISFLVWTTTPWTLPANVAIAVSEEASYAIVEGEFSSSSGTERLIIAEELVENILEKPYKIISTLTGKDLIHIEYHALYELNTTDKKAYRIVPANFISLTDGTGLVHIAPAYGAEDLEVGRKENLPIIHVVELDGSVTEFENGPEKGIFFKDADPTITADLDSKNRLLKSEKIKHTYPFCWRCDSPLLYYAKESWYIRTTALKTRLIEANKEINWYPDHIKEGRFGEWLENNVDWALSRERFWGTPIPVWNCEKCGDYSAIGSLDELKKQPGLQGFNDNLDLHRPFLDKVKFSCAKCGGISSRIPEVMDAWFDSGAMPVAQWHYPFENEDQFNTQSPADYICEGVDQTRGWFYTLHALSVLLFDRPAYKNVVSLGHILDETGSKMSKSKGNVVEPWPVLDSRGADAIRWYMYTATTPGNPRRFSEGLVGESVRKFLLPLWNTYSFFVTYANLDNFDPLTNQPPKAEDRPHLDRWLLSSLNSLIIETTKDLEQYKITEAARGLEKFVDQLSTWYIRRSRRRFWKSEDDIDKQSAYHTLHECLLTLSKLLAPFTPFISESIFKNLNSDTIPSVHLADWPKPNFADVNPTIEADVNLAIQLSSLGRAARSRAQIKVRQPLSTAYVFVKGGDVEQTVIRIADQLKDELNVKAIKTIDNESIFLDFKILPNLAKLGPRLGSKIQNFRQELETLDKDALSLLAETLQSGNNVEINNNTYSPDELIVETEDKQHYISSTDSLISVAINTEITEALSLEGFARDLVRQIQEIRRQEDFKIDSRIFLSISGAEKIDKVLANHSHYIEQETLSEIISDVNEVTHNVTINDIATTISIRLKD